MSLLAPRFRRVFRRPTWCTSMSPPGIVPSGGLLHLIALVDRGQEKEISRLQEATGVTLKREELPTDNEVVVGLIDRVLQNSERRQGRDSARAAAFPDSPPGPAPPAPAVHGVPVEVPASAGSGGRPDCPTPGYRRARFRGAGGAPRAGTAGPAPRRPGRSAGRGGAGEGFPRKVRPERRGSAVTREVQPGKGFTQLFVSIGRNRRVYARELAELFTEKLQLGANELGSVRVFDKYSFVDINPARADEAITRAFRQRNERPDHHGQLRKEEGRERRALMPGGPPGDRVACGSQPSSPSALRPPLEVEIGCGNGHFLCEYAAERREATLLGIDIKKKRCSKAREKAERRGYRQHRHHQCERRKGPS